MPTASSPDGSNQIGVHLATTLIRTEDSYPMTNAHRGSCVIINNFKFDDATKDRPEAEIDVNRIENLFEECCFDVIKFNNLTASEMMEELVNCAKSVDRKDQAFVCLLSSHGGEGILLGRDCKAIQINGILNLFNNVNCPNLKMKPKLFFLQACRGSLADRGIENVTHNSLEPLDADQYQYDDMGESHGSLITFDNNTQSILPMFSDMYIAYAAVESFKAKKSWFLEELYKEFAQWAFQEDLETVMKRVISNVVDRVYHTNDETIARKQCPEIVQRGWRKKLYLNPGQPNVMSNSLRCIRRLWPEG